MPLPNTDSFERKVSEQGYKIFRLTLDLQEGLDDHEHDYDLWGSVATGEFRITKNGETHIYGEGEEFQLDTSEEHSEVSGSEGASLVVGRRQN